MFNLNVHLIILIIPQPCNSYFLYPVRFCLDGCARARATAASRQENLMRCLHGCRSIKPHVRSCWEMNYSTFPLAIFAYVAFSAACSTGHASIRLQRLRYIPANCKRATKSHSYSTLNLAELW